MKRLRTPFIFTLLFSSIATGATINFILEVPPNTPIHDTVFIMGNRPELGSWDPQAVPLQRTNYYQWQVSVDISNGVLVLYKYCRGSWPTLERGLYGESITTRHFSVSGDTTIYDTVLSWNDIPHPFSREPYLSWIGDPHHSITVSFETTSPCTLFVDYGLTPSYGLTVEDTTFSAKHSITLEGLLPGGLYHYRVRTSSGYISQDLTFRTVPESEVIRFVAFGDNRTDSSAHQQVVNQILNQNFDFAVNTGDLVADGIDIRKWNTFFNIEENLIKNFSYMPIVGNHEQPEDDGSKFYYLFSLPHNEKWYSFNSGNIHLIGLDTEADLMGEQMDWLLNDLNSVSLDPSIDWKIVFLHRPPYSSGSHGSQLDVRNAWSGIFEDYGVDIVLCGHDHDYERSVPIGGVTYIVTGGGGAPLYPVGSSWWTAYSESSHHFILFTVTGDMLNLKAIRSDGTSMDSLTLFRLCGDIDDNGQIDTQDATYLADYLFYSGPVPHHISVADLNGDLRIDFRDISYLINYLIWQGPSPQCP